MKTRVMMCQLQVKQRHSIKKSWVIYDEVRPQLEKCFELIEKHNPGLVIFPETCYVAELHDTYTELAKGRMVIAGSNYTEDGFNQTHVYQKDGTHLVLQKMFPSPKETMEFNHPNHLMPDLVLKEWERQVEKGQWPEYFPLLDEESGLRVAVLNCMDYYRMGYYVANSSVLSPHVWGLVSPCSNGQQEVFLRLAGAIHDANEIIYSLVVNSHNLSRAPGSTQGNSFIMGPITHNTKTILSIMEGQVNDHFAFIYQLGDEAEVLMMDVLDGREVRFFARSKDFQSTPTHIKRIKLPKGDVNSDAKKG